MHCCDHKTNELKRWTNMLKVIWRACFALKLNQVFRLDHVDRQHDDVVEFALGWDFFSCLFWIYALQLPRLIPIRFVSFILLLYVLLTSKMSATIDQHKFNDISAKNTKNMHHGPLIGANTIAMKTIGADMKRPHAHISGSDFWLTTRKRCAKYDPSGTPMSPEAMATRPNLYATLQLWFVCFNFV